MSRQLKRPARSPHTVGTQDQETPQVPTGQWGLRIRRPAKFPGQWALEKEGGLGVSVTEKVASVTLEEPFSFGDLHY